MIVKMMGETIRGGDYDHELFTLFSGVATATIEQPKGSKRSERPFINLHYEAGPNSPAHNESYGIWHPVYFMNDEGATIDRFIPMKESSLIQEEEPTGGDPVETTGVDYTAEIVELKDGDSIVRRRHLLFRDPSGQAVVDTPIPDAVWHHEKEANDDDIYFAYTALVHRLQASKKPSLRVRM